MNASATILRELLKTNTFRQETPVLACVNYSIQKKLKRKPLTTKEG